MSQRVIVTRPEHDAGLWVMQLQQHGFTSISLPLIGIAAVSSAADISALQMAQNSLNSYTACMFVSSNAVEHFFRSFLGSKQALSQSIHARAAPNNVAIGVLSKPRFLAPGPGTGAALLAVGVPASQIDTPPLDAAQFDSEALWEVVGQRDWRGARVLIVRGKADAASDASADASGSSGIGREWLIEKLRACGAAVDLVSSYQRCAPQMSDEQIDIAKAASRDGSVWLFSSSEAVVNLTSQPRLKDVNWQAAVAIATHPRIQAAAQAAGWGVVQSSRPAIEDILASLASIESMTP